MTVCATKSNSPLARMCELVEEQWPGSRIIAAGLGPDGKSWYGFAEIKEADGSEGFRNFRVVDPTGVVGAPRVDYMLVDIGQLRPISEARRSFNRQINGV